jgi:uncharacterized protein YndB with AHSA1/START domain
MRRSTRLAPIERSVSVSWDPPAAFRRFTGEFGSWWPYRTHSIGGDRIARLVFEPRVGGRIFEEHRDGRRFQWGEVLVWEPPHRVRFTWHPARDPSTAQDVAIEFLPEGSGTLLRLTADGWERWGRGAARARKGYRVGWGYVLNVWAGRRTPGMSVLDVVAAGINVVQKLRGGVDAEIARAGGEIKGV